MIAILVTVGLLTFLTFCWIFGIDAKSILITLTILAIIFIVMVYICVPEINVKYRIIGENNKYTTLEDVNQYLTKEEANYYKLAILAKPDKCTNHTVKYIINLGKDIAASVNIKNYIN